MKITSKIISECIKTFGVLSCVALMNVASVKAQEVVWKKNFGGMAVDEYSSVTAVSDGVVAVGSSYAGSFATGDWAGAGVMAKGLHDAIIVKYDINGNIVWKNSFGGDASDYYSAITAVPDGVVVAGRSHLGSFGTGDWTGIATKGNNDAIILKYDNNGNMVWKSNFGGGSIDRYNSITAVSDGVVAVGYSYIAFSGEFGTSGDWAGVLAKGYNDAIIVKYDHNGNIVWKNNFGGRADDEYTSVTTVSDGVVAVGNSVQNSFGFGDWADVPSKGNNDAIIVKYDYNGNVVWKNSFGGNSQDYFDAVTEVPDGVVAVGHSYNASFGSGDWEGVTVNSYNTTAIIVKYDHNGNVVWKKKFGGEADDFYYSVTTASDGVIATGHSVDVTHEDWEGTDSRGSRKAIMVKYDNNGNVIWKTNFGGSGYVNKYTSSTAVSNGVVAAGLAQDDFGFNDWEGVTGNGSDDAIIVKYTESNIGISDVSKISVFRIYPNPTTDRIFIEGENLLQATIILYNMLGEEVLSQAIYGTTEINLRCLPKGMYSFSIISEEKLVETGKIVKQ